jgi:hypothetical protein
VTRRYFLLFVGIAILGLALSYVARSERFRPRATQTTAAAPAPRAAISLRVRNGSIEPSATRVPLGARVSLEVANEGRDEARLALAGYGARLPEIDLAPGGVWKGEFTADLPGEDFAWLIDGRPAGRLLVAGSHLIEGHR